MLRYKITSRLASVVRATGFLCGLGMVLSAPPADAQAVDLPAGPIQVSPAQAAQQPNSTPLTVGPTAPRVPPSPRDVSAAKAYSMLERNCARCHQDGRLKDGVPARNFANILALDEIARDPALVRPGSPDASRLYTSILTREMPYDVYHGQGGEEPTADEIQALRDWINDLPVPANTAPAGPATPTAENKAADAPGQTGTAAALVCAGRSPVTHDQVTETIANAVQSAGTEKARQLRFFSIASLYNTCATMAELSAFRQAVALVVNSLSWSPTVVRLETIGPHDVVLALTLSNVGWIPAHWEQLATKYPLRSTPGSRLPQEVLDATGTRTPLLSADWFAAEAMRPPLYYELLGIPGRFGNLQRILRADIDADVKRGVARRGAVAQSGETRAGRILERHPAATGGLWLSYDLAAGSGRQNVLDHPLGPTAGEAGRTPFRHDATKSLFHLPNGLPAFSINDARGDRLDRGVAEVEKERPGSSQRGLGAGGNRLVQAGADCLQCHRSGPLGFKDDVRTHVENDRTAPREYRDAVQTLYGTEQEMAKLVESDQERTIAALATIGVDPELRIWGLDLVQALGRAWQRRVDLNRAAADFGVAPPVLLQRISGVTGDEALTARQLRQGVARRSEVDRLFESLAASTEPATAASGVPKASVAPSDRLDLVIWADTDSHVAGQSATLYAQTTQDCHLTLVNVDRLGRATVLFPNEFEPNNLIGAGREHRMPGAESPYRFRLKERGRETFVAICSKNAKAPEGVFHDFDRLRFTVLGDWQIFLREPPALEEARRDDSAQDRPRPQQRRPRARTEPPRSTGPDIQARTAITVDVK